MACYVLVHGAWSGGWVYQAVARGLRQAGHEVYVPTLTGLGERAHLVGQGLPISLSLHIRDITALLECEDLHDVILCGHSYGGMVISGVASLMHDRIRTLFYLDAFLPANGQSLWDLLAEPVRASMMDSQRRSGQVAPIHRAGTEGATIRRMPQSFLCFTEGVKLTGAEQSIAHRTYVYATENKPSSFVQFYEALRDDPGWSVKTVATGHMVMHDDPQALIVLLAAEAQP
jgi:pimeloyl-ACP methyl ester carboxylesterase